VPDIDTTRRTQWLPLGASGHLAQSFGTRLVGATSDEEEEEVPAEQPLLEVLSPVPGASIAASAEVHARVTDASALSQVVLTVSLGGGALEEVAFNGTRFASTYAENSTTSAVEDGWEFRLRRAGGWPSGNFTLRLLPLLSEEG
jgi:hypothetical protein